MTPTLPTVLIVTKDAASRGGVAGYYNLFFRTCQDTVPQLERFDIGSRSTEYYKRRQRALGYGIEYICDVIRFLLLLRKRPDIRVVQLNPSLIPVPLIRDGLLLLLSRWCRRRTIVFVRGWRDDIADAIGKSPWQRALFRAAFSRADRIIVLADDFSAQLERLGIAREKMLVSRTMYDGDLIQPRSETADSEIRFLYLGRISREKGALEVVEAAGMLKERGLPFRITFHGHGATADAVPALRARAAVLGVCCHIHVGEFVEGEEKYRAYAEADVFLLPSHHEGCPNSILEAMGAGCYVICTGAGAMKEVVQDGVNGSVVRIGDADDLAEKMTWTINNLPAVREMGRANRDYALSHFESRVITDQVFSIYDDLLSRR